MKIQEVLDIIDRLDSALTHLHFVEDNASQSCNPETHRKREEEQGKRVEELQELRDAIESQRIEFP